MQGWRVGPQREEQGVLAPEGRAEGRTTGDPARSSRTNLMILTPPQARAPTGTVWSQMLSLPQPPPRRPHSPVGWKGPPEEEEEEEDEEEDEAEVKLLTPFPLLSFLPL